MNTQLWDWLLLVGATSALVFFNAVFVASEFSLVKLRYSHFNPDLLDDLKEQPKFVGLLDRVDLTLRVLRLGITLCTLGLGLMIWAVSENVCLGLGYELNETAFGVVLVLSIVLAILLKYIVGELVPRGIGLQKPVSTLQKSVLIIRFLKWIATPVLGVMNGGANFLLKLFGFKPDVGLGLLDIEVQIEKLEDEDATSGFSQKIFKNVISMRELVMQDVMLPRNQIQFFDTKDSNEENIKIAKESGHTRFPLCKEDMDNCVGIIHIKDLFRSSENPNDLDLEKIVRPVVYCGSEDPLEDVLEILLSSKLHMALVRDEFGGTVGVVTLENIMEEVVGDIQDEFDSEEEQIEEVEEDVYIADGLTPLHEIEEKLGIEIEEDEVSTIGGLITLALGKIPLSGQVVRYGNLEIEVMDVDEKRVLSAKLSLLVGDNDRSSK